MKKATLFAAALMLIIGSAFQTRAQDVALGDATFNATSDQVSTNWFLPMLPGVTNTFEGFGVNDGLTKTEQYSTGETVVGVKAVKRHIEGSSPAVPTEDWWLALDSNADLRVLKLVRADAVVFEASAAATPPVLLPGIPTDGQTWDLFDTTMTIDWVVLSFSGAKMKVTETSGLAVQSHYYSDGGLSSTESASSSGWRRVR